MPLPSHSTSVRGVCPACGTALLFVGDGGYLTCSLHNCPDPSAADRLLMSSRSVVAAVRAGSSLAREVKQAVEALDGP